MARLHIKILLAKMEQHAERVAAKIARAKRLVGQAQVANATIFAFYRLHPVPIPKCTLTLDRHAEHLARITPYLPKRLPKWMRTIK